MRTYHNPLNVNSMDQAHFQLDAVHLTKVVQPERSEIILHDVSLSVLPGEFVAIVGKSGAGKSTLLDILSGRRSSFGQVFVNGHDIQQVYNYYRAAFGYVPQHGILHPSLTVERSLWYAAHLRLPPHTPAQEIEARIHHALEEVELPDRMRDQPIHTLSGGEQKRVNIAAELLTAPLLFFLDEPTSGLDPLLEKKMMQTLRHMADAGRTVILVTHATSTITLCDYVAFVSDGWLTFFGPPADALEFFGVDDFADIYDTIDGQGEYWHQQFHMPWARHYKELIADRQQTRYANHDTVPQAFTTTEELWWQFKALSRRLLELIFRDRTATFLLVIVMPLIALALLILLDTDQLVGPDHIPEYRTFAAWRSAESALVMIGLASVILGLFGGSYELIKERPLFIHEYLVNLKLPSYLLSKLVVLGGFAFVQCALFLAVLSLKIHLPRDGMLLSGPLELFITLVLSTLASLAVGLFISAIANSLNTTTYMAILVLFFQILFSGATLNLDRATKLISHFTILRWTVDGLGSTINMEALGSKTQLCTLHECEQISVGVQSMGVTYGTNLDHLITVWSVLVGITALFMGLTAFFVSTIANSKR